LQESGGVGVEKKSGRGLIRHLSMRGVLRRGTNNLKGGKRLKER